MVRPFSAERDLLLTIPGIGPKIAAVIIWNVLRDAKPYAELGADFYTRHDDPEREKQRLIAKLNTLDYQVTVQTAS